MTDRRGNNKKLDGTWPKTDGKGCGYCGAIGQGQHGERCVQSALWIDEEGMLVENSGFTMRIKEPE